MPDVRLGKLYFDIEGRDVSLSRILTDSRAEMQRTAKEGGNLAGSLDAGLGRIGGTTLKYAGAIGVATSAIEVFSATAQRVQDGFNLAAKLDEQRRSLGILFQDVERGNEVFDKAIAFGRQYGFTQEEMGAAASSSAKLIRESSLEVSKQFEIIARLASLNTEEGFAGASRAIAELASGDITSIVERFNLSRQEITALKNEIASGADVFQVLDQYLQQNGVSAEVLANRMEGAAGAARSYAQAQEDLNLAMGRFAEGPGVAALDLITKLTNGMTNLLTVGQTKEDFAANAFGKAEDFATYQANIESSGVAIQTLIQTVEQLSGQKLPFVAEFAQMALGIDSLTQGQYDYARALEATGVSQEAALAAAREQSGLAQALDLSQKQIANTDRERAAALGELIPLIIQATAAGGESAARAEEITNGFLNNALSYGAAREQLAGLVAVDNAHTQGQAQSAAMTTYRRGEIELLNAATQNATNALQVDSDALADNLAKSQQTTLQTQTLAAAQRELANLGGAVVNGLMSSGDAALVLAQKYGIAIGEANALIAAQAQLAQAKAYAAGKADYRAGERGLLNGTGATTTASEERMYVRSLGLQQQAEAHASAARGRAGSARVGQAQKLSNQLAADQLKFNQKTEDIEQTHLDKMLDINERYEDRVRKQQEANELSKRQSRLGFYEALVDASDTLGDGAVNNLRAQYEQAYAESQQLAQQGQTKLAADMLALRQQQLTEDIRLQKEAAESRKVITDQKSSEEERAEAQSVLDKQKMLAQLRDDARREEIEQLKRSGDELVNERQRQIDEEGERYQKATEDAAQNFENLNERRVDSWQRANNGIAAMPPAEARAFPGNTSASKPSSTPESATPKSQSPTPQSVMPVFDSSVVDAIKAQTDSLKAAIDDSASRIEQATEGVESAVRSISSNSLVRP